jgi:hypothetical protein
MSGQGSGAAGGTLPSWQAQAANRRQGQAKGLNKQKGSQSCLFVDTNLH